MNKILYDKISNNDNLVLVVQALIDKQAEIIDNYNYHMSWHKDVCKYNVVKGLERLAEKQETVK